MYDATAVEKKWSDSWQKSSNMFLFDEKDTKRPLFVIDTPPPFTNGELHMGQIFWVSYIDAVARYKRMKGFNVLYPVGWDEHGFPTEFAVEKKYGRNLPREEFYKKCVEVSLENGKKMREQMLQLGATFDDRYEYHTTGKDYLRKTQLSLLILYEKGLVYRGSHPVLWCPRCVSGVSNSETQENEEDTALNYVNFKISGGKKKEDAETITIATTRPELLHACVALAVNPKDKKFKKLIGKEVTTPIFGKKVKIIGDEQVNMEFGTGAEMVCTFGDKADIGMYYRNGLDLIEAMDQKGILMNADKYNGLQGKEAREKVIQELKDLGFIVKQEKIKHTVKLHDRCGTPLEYIKSSQWFIKTKDHLDKVKQITGEMKWHPETSKQRLYDWANFLDYDWNISRNRVFGTPFPFWVCEKCDFALPAGKEMLPIDPNQTKPKSDKCPKCGGKLVGVKDTNDSWVDTSITPLVIAGWPDNKKLFERAFPNAVRIQGTDIIRTWAFSTVLRSYLLTGNKPFENLIAHGMIHGVDGREMHKRFGNGIFLPDLVPKYSIDNVRLWVALSGGIGKDHAFSYAEMDYARGFLTKLWNSASFVKTATAEIKEAKKPEHDYNVFDIWILNRLNQTIKEVTEDYDNFLLNGGMSKIIAFYWHEFCDYYIENVKHRIYSKEKKMEKSKKAAAATLKYVLLNTLKMVAPVAPFISEEINSMFSKDSIFAEKFPEYAEVARPSDYVINGILQTSAIELDYTNAGAFLNGVIGEVRKQKAQQKIALNKEITSININVPDEYISAVENAKDDIKSICKASKINVKKQKEFSVSISL